MMAMGSSIRAGSSWTAAHAVSLRAQPRHVRCGHSTSKCSVSSPTVISSPGFKRCSATRRPFTFTPIVGAELDRRACDEREALAAGVLEQVVGQLLQHALLVALELLAVLR